MRLKPLIIAQIRPRKEEKHTQTELIASACQQNIQPAGLMSIFKAAGFNGYTSRQHDVTSHDFASNA
jgi:hypothetical protein